MATTSNGDAVPAPKVAAHDKVEVEQDAHSEEALSLELAHVVDDAEQVQVTPPPSERMKDHRNPPQPPRKVKKQRRSWRDHGRREVHTPPLLDLLPRVSVENDTATVNATVVPPLSLPGSPVSVFRSLDEEFALVQNENNENASTQESPERVRRLVEEHLLQQPQHVERVAFDRPPKIIIPKAKRQTRMTHAEARKRKQPGQCPT